MSRSLPKKNNPLILADAAPACKFTSRRAVSRKLSLLHHLMLTRPCRRPSLTHLPLLFVIADGDLLTRRRLGRTTLSVKPELVGNSNATKPENLGVFEYVHLRAPLPEDLRGSEIFLSHTLAQHPDSYFLMVRIIPGARAKPCYTRLLNLVCW